MNIIKQLVYVALGIIIALCLFGPRASYAANVTLMTGFLSNHSGSGVSSTTGKPHNEVNNGIGLRFDAGKLQGWMIGTYDNSHYKQSVYVAREWKTSRVGPFQLGIVAGAVTGYKMDAIPLVLPEFIVNMWRAELVFLVQPFDVSTATAMAAMQLRWRFW